MNVIKERPGGYKARPTTYTTPRIIPPSTCSVAPVM
jgi:hypothetical protein